MTLTPEVLAEAMFTADGRIGWGVIEPPFRLRWVVYARKVLADPAVAAALSPKPDLDGGWTTEDWEEWSNDVASAMPEHWDGDEAQEDIIKRFVAYAADHLGACPVERTRIEEPDLAEATHYPRAEVDAVTDERLTALAEHLEGMADSLDDHVTHEDIHRLLIEALAIARGES